MLRTACDLEQGTVDCRRRVLGADDPDTLPSANNLTGYLRALAMQAARNREQDTL